MTVIGGKSLFTGRFLTNYALIFGLHRRSRKWYWPFPESDASLRFRLFAAMSAREEKYRAWKLWNLGNKREAVR